MPGILKFSEGISISIRAMLYLLSEEDKLISVKEIATILNVSEGHLAKVMQQLAKEKLIDSVRGPKGGFKLKKSGKEIKLIEIYEIIEGPFQVKDCVFNPICEGDCSLRKLVVSANEKFFNYFKNTTLEELLDSTQCKNKFKEKQRNLIKIK
ncbi:MAG: hypothetical protein A2255_06195 [Candidatus Melainabacteria bacterium RIFOXYA2_FULL_32_9]|nr:MAG: hypothetical protein A2255_06195 [Candidatus Melainabacteria bacterium RIFOXYA2_FULL_32_9]